MNILRKKHDGQVMRWEPFATSTPLKPISVNSKDKYGTYPIRPPIFVPDVNQKVSDVSKNFHNKPSVGSKTRISGTNRSKAYFDLSSSSDEESDNCPIETNRPVIKIGTEDTDKVNLVAADGKCNKGIKNHSINIRKLGNTNRQILKCNTQQRPKSIEKNKFITSKSVLENIDLDASNEINVPDTVTNFTPENYRPLSMTLKCRQGRKKEEKEAHKLISKKSTPEVNGENCENVESSLRLLKRRGKKHRNTVCVKKRRQVQIISSENQVMAVEKHTNSSHQLFTDSTQEELINTLCLTSSEVEEADANIDFSKVIQKSVTKSKTNKKIEGSKKYENVKTASPAEKQDRPKRTRQAPKEYWVINGKPKVGLKDKPQGTKIPRRKIVDPVTKCVFVPSLNSPISNHASEAVISKHLNVTQTASESKVSAGQNYLKSRRSKQEVKKLNSVPSSKGQSGTKNDEVPLVNNKIENTVKHAVFLPLNEISYLENEFGHQVSQVCNMKNFKCGVFKLQPGSNFTWKKSQRRNCMGGVLVKGEMRMTVGDHERTLREGDMVLVPPSSECRAVNTGECDFIFYYWCKTCTK